MLNVKNMEERPPTPMVLKYFLLLFLISILLLGRLLWPFLSILVLSYLLTGTFRPVYSFFNKKMSANLASLVTCGLIVILVFVPLGFFVGALTQEAYILYQWGKGAKLGTLLKELQSGEVLTRIQDYISGFGLSLQPESISNTLSDLAKELGLFLYNQASSWAANIMQFLFQFILMILVIFFLLIDQDKLVEFCLRLSPLPDDQERRLIEKFEEITGAVLIGNGICGLIQGVLGGLAFAVFDLGPPVLWGGIMAILAFLPIFGIGLVLIPSSIILFIKGSIATAIFMLVFYMVLSFSIEYLLKPKLVGEQVKMHTLLVFLAILGGLSVFGFLGIFYGPLIVTAFLTLADIYLANYDKYIKEGEMRRRQIDTEETGSQDDPY